MDNYTHEFANAPFSTLFPSPSFVLGLPRGRLERGGEVGVKGHTRTLRISVAGWSGGLWLLDGGRNKDGEKEKEEKRNEEYSERGDASMLGSGGSYLDREVQGS